MPPLFAAGGLLYAAAGLASALAAGAGRPGLLRAAGMAGLVLVGCAVADLAREEGPRRALAAAAAAGVVGSAVLALAGIALFALGSDTALAVPASRDLEPGTYARARALFHHPNGLASFTLAAVALACLPGGPRPRTRTLVQLSGAAVVLLAIARAAVPYALLLVLLRRGPRPRVAVALAGGALLAVATLSLVHVRLDPSRPGALTVAEEPAARAQALAGAWRSFVENPLLGVGPERHAASLGGWPLEAHCTPLNVAARFGVVALAGLALVAAAAWRGASAAGGAAARAGLLAFAIDALAQDAEDFRHAWVLLGAATSARSASLHRPPAA